MTTQPVRFSLHVPSTTRVRRAATVSLLVALAGGFAPGARGVALDDRGTVAGSSTGVVAAQSQHTQPTPGEDLKPFVFAYTQHIYTLSNPFMEGRAPGTQGNRRAADYVEFCYKSLGLAPAFTDTSADGASTLTYRQVFTAPASRRPGDSIRITKQVVSFGNSSLKPGVDFNPLGYSANGTATGPLVFVGYSIEEGDNDYTSYPRVDGKDVDLAGKIAVLFRFEPMNEAGKSKWAETRWSGAAALDAKIRAATSRNAAGVIVINPPGAADTRANRLEDASLGSPLKVPVVMLTPEAGADLLKAADPQQRPLTQFRAMADEQGGVVDLPNAQVTLDVATEKVPLLTDNVGAIIAGVGPLKDEYVVVGSHYDHVGYGYFGSRDPNPRGKLHPGADDNASGTSGNLLVARRLKEACDALPPDQPRRSILFLAFSAEESGLVGSKFYTQHPITSKSQHAIMINMDMIGRLREDKGLELGGVGTAEGLSEWLTPYVSAAPFAVAPKPSGLGPSDHASFANWGVPALFFFTGLHKEYHSPADTADTINVDGATQVADLAYRVALDAALRPERFIFTTATGKPKGDDAGDDEPQEKVGTVQGTGVRFGIAPGDYSGDDGVMVGEVFPDLPAAKAGLKEGDKMTSWNGEKLSGVESWMPMLQKPKPRDKVTTVYVRTENGAEKEYTTEATLIARQTAPQ